MIPATRPRTLDYTGESVVGPGAGRWAPAAALTAPASTSSVALSFP